MRRKKIQIPVLPYYFNLFIFNDKEEMNKAMKGKVEDDSLSCPAFVTTIKGVDHLIIVKDKDFEFSFIVHECVHIKNNMFDWIGYKSNSPNDEMEAYFLQYIFIKVSEFYNGKD